MKHNFGTVKAFAIGIIASVALSTSAMAATVGSAATGSSSVGGFVMNGGQAMVDVSNGAYTSVPGDTDPASTWVWDAAGNQSQTTNTFVWTFDLTGFKAATAMLTGLWGVDNFGTASLNGNIIGGIDYGYPAFQTLEAVADGASTPMFLAGVNTLSFETTNGFQTPQNGNPGPGAFRAGVVVTAAAVPIPAALPLLMLGLGGLGIAGRRRKKS